MLAPTEVVYLLEDLCIRLGFCLPPEARTRLEKAPPRGPQDFAESVFRAEGLDPQLDKTLYSQVLATVEAAFHRSVAPDA